MKIQTGKPEILEKSSRPRLPSSLDDSSSNLMNTVKWIKHGDSFSLATGYQNYHQHNDERTAGWSKFGRQFVQSDEHKW